jgi:hypothetical protein
MASAEEYLNRGIHLHANAKDDGDLADSAYNFKLAAEGGSSGGAVFYGEESRPLAIVEQRFD